ncbi:MAG TPA: shikimate kinase [Bacteroidales bacterium]|nr:shikimate kinase [Bacteroidales bacterium]
MHTTDRIFLVGFMGSGKTTAGRKLASRLGWSFIDLDELIERDNGMSVAKIFAERGEEWFRTVESNALREIGNNRNTVISTGGGTPCFFGNMEFMLKNGLTVYLKMTPEKLNRRLSRSTAGRPLLKNIGKKELPGYISALLNERELWYSRAEITIEIERGNISALLSLIKNRLG